MAKTIVVNDERCMACRQCMTECAMAHTEAATLIEAINSDTPPQPRVHVEAAGQFGMPMQCQHCDDAPCITICPVEAIARAGEDAPVLIDAERCIGCKFCVMVCPFGVIDMSRSSKAVVKCDLCIERTEAGQDPACVAGCPTGALEFREMDDWIRQRRRQAAERVAAGTGAAEKEAD